MTYQETKILNNFFSELELEINLDSPYFDFTDTSTEYKTSEEMLYKLQEQYHDIPTARRVVGNDNRMTFRRDTEKVKEVESLLSDELQLNLYCSGCFLYPKYGYCGWHTNSNVVGTRIYYAYVPEDGKSFFSTFEDDKVNVSYDNQGWNKRQFHVKDGNDKLWHCVGSYTNRFSLGFQVRPNKKTHSSII